MTQFWHDFLEVATVVISLLGFGLVYLQLRASRKSLETQTSWQIYSVSGSVLKVFLDHPECRKYFYGNVPLPADQRERDVVLTAVELVCDLLENTFIYRQSVKEETNAVWEDYVQKMYERSTVMRQFLSDDQEGYRYNKEFIQMARALHARGNTLSP